jgi:hypothetical protein
MVIQLRLDLFQAPVNSVKPPVNSVKPLVDRVFQIINALVCTIRLTIIVMTIGSATVKNGLPEIVCQFISPPSRSCPSPPLALPRDCQVHA